ncbi:MAG: murein biosynthesis integral membrane protein MurJ [Acidimicrobiales bacterium]
MRSSALISAGVLLSRLTGLVRLLLLVSVLGEGGLGDVYAFANNVPNLIYELLAGGVLSAVLLPLFVDLLARDDRDGLSVVVTTSVLLLGLVAVVGVVAAPAIGWAVAAISGGGSRAAQQEAFVHLLRWVVPQVFFYGLITVVSSLLQAGRRFGAAAFAPVLNNLVVIVTLVVLQQRSALDLATAPLAEVLTDPATLTILGAGTTAGVAINAVALVPSLQRCRLGLRVLPRWRHPVMGRMWSAGRGALGFVAVSQVGVLVTTLMANAWKETGQYVAYINSGLLLFVAYGVLVVSVTTAVGPELASTAQSGDTAGFRQVWLRGLRLIVLLTAPASAAMVVLAQPIFELLPLTDDSTQLYAGLFQVFSVGLVPFSISQYVIRSFYARSDTRTPVRIALVQYGVIIGLGLVVAPIYQVPGLSVVYTIGYGAAGLVAFSWFARSLGRLRFSEVAMLPRMAAAAVGAAVVMAAVLALLGWGARTTPPTVQLVAGGLVGLVVYPGFLWAMGTTSDLQAGLDLGRRVLRR